MTNTVLTYKGRPITDLTKNELVDAMTWAFQEIEYQRERADRFLNAAALAESKPQRRCLYSPVQIAECGGPCEQGPEHCDCGELCVTERLPRIVVRREGVGGVRLLIPTSRRLVGVSY